MRKSNDQIMGYWLNEPAILNPQLMVDAIADLAGCGYDIIRVMLRNTNYHHRHPAVVNAMKIAAEAAHRHGLKIVYDAEPHRLATQDMGAEFPDAVASRLVMASAELVNGEFCLHVACDDFYADMPIFKQVEAAFVIDGKTAFKIDDFAYDLTWEVTTLDDGHTRQRQDYLDHTKFKMSRHLQLSGRLNDFSHGKLVIYCNCLDVGLADFAAAGFQEYYRQLADCFREVALDGVCWDEPGVGGNWRNYRYGDAFAEYFKQRCGYRLSDRLYLLDLPELSSESVKVRIDYYDTLNESLFAAQQSFIAAARQIFGADLLLGTHHTWQGEGGSNDYRAGAVDYFRLSDNMDAGYTDCCWWDQNSVAYSYLLCSSLARLTGSGVAECNTWHWKPTRASVAYNGRLMTLMNINWFNIWYGQNSDTCMYPAHYTWDATVKAMQQHKELQALLADARPAADIAVLHDWRSVAAANNESFADLHKAFCLNLSGLAVDGNLAFDFIDERLLAQSSVNDGKLCCRLGEYRILVLPFAVYFTVDSYQKVKEFIAGGGKVIFCGPPPQMLADANDLTGEFARMMGMEAIAFAQYQLWFRSRTTKMPQGRPDAFDVVYHIRPTTGALLLSVEGEPAGIRSPEFDCVYFSGYEPSGAVFGQLQEWQKSDVECHSDSVMFREYRRRDCRLLAVIARDGKAMRGLLHWHDRCLMLTGGTAAVLEWRQNQPCLLGGDLDYHCCQIAEA